MSHLKILAGLAAIVTTAPAQAASLIEQISPNPTAYAQVVDFGIADFGPRSADVTADLFATSGDSFVGGLALGCYASDYRGTEGKIALVSRGLCTLVMKVELAQAAGAVGVLIVENIPNPNGVANLGGVSQIVNIPAFRLARPLGIQLADLARQEPVTLRLVMDDRPPPAGVPEPTTWALMIAGFGLTGATLRRRQAAPATATTA